MHQFSLKCIVPQLCNLHWIQAFPCVLTGNNVLHHFAGLGNLTNTLRGSYYGPAQGFSKQDRQRLGVSLLHKSMMLLLCEGERQLRPLDLPPNPWSKNKNKPSALLWAANPFQVSLDSFLFFPWILSYSFLFLGFFPIQVSLDSLCIPVLRGGI